MRILFAGFSHETNTFSPHLTGPEEFEANGIYRGDRILALAGTNTVAGGVLAEADNHPHLELDLVVDMSAIPGGLVTRSALDPFINDVIAASASTRPDAIVLDLHGAMVAEGEDDGDGAILRRVRQAVGPDMPVITVLDLHANVGSEMIENATALIPYDTYPHVDSAARGEEALRLAVRSASGEVSPVMRHQKLSMFLAGQKQYSHVEPTLSVMKLVHEIEAREGVLTAGVCFAFPWADCPFAGMTVTVVTDGDPDMATRYAEEIGSFIWSNRERFRPDVMTVEEAVHHAMQAEQGPVVMADLGDNPGGGSAADGTALLWAMLDLGAINAAYALIADPEVVDVAFGAGIGSTITTELGGKTDNLHGYPIPVEAVVKNLTDGAFVNEGPMSAGVSGTLGRTAVLGCKGRHGNEVEVIVCERRVQPYDAAVFRSQGIEPTGKQMLGVKSAVHFRASFEPLASEVLDVDTPGLTSIDFSRFPYKRLKRPMWPLDDI